MKIGTYYYPEQWPREQWQRDFDNIARLGLQIVHMAEFAWFDLEPEPGIFHFDWLDECLELARQRELQVILCTPTAAPPVWLSAGHPATLPTMEPYGRARFGGRRHYNPLSPEFIAATRRIVSAMAEHFGDHLSVIGWQIDNEYGNNFDQSEITHHAFQNWLRHKYGEISSLNRAWGCAFWNQYYTSFEQILMPPSREPRYGNPHQHLDASRFWSWAFAQFNRVQTDILRPRIGNRFLTTNFMHLHLDCDPKDFAEDFSLMAWDSYPATGLEPNPPDQRFRIADPSSIGLMHDEMAGFGKPWGLMELQPGQVNWTMVPVRVLPGAVRLWLWTAFAHGAAFTTTYRFRQPRFGVELFHHGLMGTDGVTPSPGGREFAQVISEMKQIDLDRVPPFVEQPIDARRTVGLIFDFEQLWWFQTLPQTRRWDQRAWLIGWYAAISRLGVRVVVLRPGASWPKEIPLIVAPAVQMIEPETVDRMRAYAEEGGNLVITCRTGLMDRNGQLWEGPWAKPILPLIGATIDGYDSMPEGVSGQVRLDGRSYPWETWADQLTPEDQTEVLARYVDQFYAGAAAITRRKLGQGTVSYFGVNGDWALIDAFMQKLAKEIGADRLALEDVPTRVQVLRRGPYRIALNYQDGQLKVPAAKGARFILGGEEIGPADVAIWEELPADDSKSQENQPATDGAQMNTDKREG